MKRYILASLLVFLSGCSDNAIVKLYEKDFSNPPCLRLVVFPPDDIMQKDMDELYSFEDSCEYKLQVSKKGGITCNSTHNAAQKNISSFPSGYLKMDIMKDTKTLYSYYIDLKNAPTKSDLKKAFARVKEDINLK